MKWTFLFTFFITAVYSFKGTNRLWLEFRVGKYVALQCEPKSETNANTNANKWENEKASNLND